MNDQFGWLKGKRIYDTERERCSRLFRSHVNTRSNPRGRIFRMICAFCKPDQQTSMSQAHHPDYKKPFLVVWCCDSHHRMIDHGSLYVSPSKLCDYSGLVAPLLRPGASVTLRARAKRIHLVSDTENTPF